MKLLSKLFLITGVSASLMGCLGTGGEEATPVDYSTTEFTTERLLDGGGTYVMDAKAVTYLASNPDIFANGQGLSTEFNEGEVATLSFELLPTGVVEAEFQITQGGDLEHFVTADVTINEDGTLGLKTFVANPDNSKSLEPGEDYNLVGEIVKDLQGNVYIAFEGSVFHYPADQNVIGNELFLRD